MNNNLGLPFSFLQPLLSEGAKKRAERIIISLAIGSFALHLLAYYFVKWDIIHLNDYSKLLTSPIAAIYTPFSFILVFEVYLLVYYLPKSITTYISKQYEIITLIVIRRVFKDLANLELTSNWFQDQGYLQFTFDILATVILFFLIFLFYRLKKSSNYTYIPPENLGPSLQRFIRLKKRVSLILVPILLILAVYSFSNWIIEHFLSVGDLVDSITDVNNVFFDEFFTILILADVFLLLFSFLHVHHFSKIIRNSGFVLSTILIKISFGTTGLLNTILVVAAVGFGICFLAIHNLYEKLEERE